jgi:hypothetical protein
MERRLLGAAETHQIPMSVLNRTRVIALEEVGNGAPAAELDDRRGDHAPDTSL